MNSKSNSAAFMGRVNSDVFRVLTVALNTKTEFDGVHILRVEVSADLGNAKVFVNRGADKLENITGFFKNEIAQNIKLRRVPALRFIVDDGEKNAARVEELLKKIKGEA